MFTKLILQVAAIAKIFSNPLFSLVSDRGALITDCSWEDDLEGMDSQC